MYLLEMTIAFCVLFGGALFFRKVFKVNTSEGMALSVIFCTLMLVISSMAGSFKYGIICLEVIAFIGTVLWFIGIKKSGKEEIKDTFSPAMVFIILFFGLSLFLYYNDFLRHIDEFHHWAATVRFMLNADRMPVGMSLGNCAYITSVFILFFQKFTGYSEQGMYVAMSLFVWIGLLLPFSRYSWKNWYKVFAYAAIIYIAVFSLYGYGFKSLYVDIPLAAWAGGLAAWWAKCEKRKANYLIAASGLMALFFCKASAGLLMACFVLLYMIIFAMLFKKSSDINLVTITKVKKGIVLLCGIVIIGSALLLGMIHCIEPYETTSVQQEEMVLNNTTETVIQQWSIAGYKLPDAFSNIINSVTLSDQKVVKTLSRFITKGFGTSLSSRSNLSITFISAILLIIIIFVINGDLYYEEKKRQIYLYYVVFTILAYLAAVFFSFLLMFVYESSVEVRSANRYFTILVVYLLVLALSELLQERCAVKEKTQKYVVLGIALFFSLGLNGKYIPNTTALDKENASNYSTIFNTRELVNQVKNNINKTDKVYYICQQPADDLNGADLINNVVLYYLENQVSSYNHVPWKFTNTGSIVRLESINTSIREFPQLLVDGGYSYVWVHTTNPYLTRELPLVLPCDDEINSGDLYKIIYENGKPLYMELVRNIAK